MKGKIKYAIAITTFFCLLFTGCSKDVDMLLDNKIYLKDTATIKLYEATSESEQSLSTFCSQDDCVLNRYKYITFNANKKWTYGLTLQSIVFEILSNETSTLDFTITISYLKNAENFNSTFDFFYFQKQFYVNCQQDTPEQVLINVNDDFLNKDAQISISLDASCLSRSETFKYSITNLKLYGEHIPTNY